MHGHERGLARPVGAEQGEDTAPHHVDVYAAQHVHLSLNDFSRPRTWNAGPRTCSVVVGTVGTTPGVRG